MNAPRPLSEPRKKAIRVLLDNPTISEREAAKLAGVSRGTIRIVRVEYAFNVHPGSPFIIGANGKVMQRRRRFLKLANGKRKLMRTWYPWKIYKKLLSVADDIAALSNEKERHLAITELRQLVRKAIERKKRPHASLDQLATAISQTHAAGQVARRR